MKNNAKWDTFPILENGRPTEINILFHRQTWHLLFSPLKDFKIKLQV